MNGALLLVESVPCPTAVVLSSPSSDAVTIPAATRLLIVSDRPTVFVDPFGTTPCATGSHVVADADGRASAYIAERLFDYVVTEEPPQVVTTSTATLTGNASSLNWSHEIDTENALSIVAIAWQSALGENSIESV